MFGQKAPGDLISFLKADPHHFKTVKTMPRITSKVRARGEVGREGRHSNRHGPKYQNGNSIINYIFTMVIRPSFSLHATVCLFTLVFYYVPLSIPRNWACLALPCLGAFRNAVPSFKRG